MTIYEAMKAPEREILARATVTYTSPELDQLVVTANDFNSTIGRIEQLYDGRTQSPAKWFSLAENAVYDELVEDPEYQLYDELVSTMGWWSEQVSLADGTFSTPLIITATFFSRTMRKLTLVGDYSYNRYPVHFKVELFGVGDALLYSEEVLNNTQVSWDSSIEILDVVKEVVTIYSINHGERQAIVQELYTNIVETYESDMLYSADIYEETSFDNDFRLLGKVSANSVALDLNNADGRFSPNNEDSPLQGALKKNRKIEVFLGARTNGDIEWFPWGIYWSYRWKPERRSLSASVYALDTLDLLYQIPFDAATMAGSVADVYRAIFQAGKLDTVDYNISAAVEALQLPLMWFARGSCRDALQYLTESLLVHVHCDHFGTIQVVHWSETLPKKTSFTDTEDYEDIHYPSLLENFYNIVEVELYTATHITAETVYDEQEVITLAAGETLDVYCLYAVEAASNAQAASITKHSDIVLNSQADYSYGSILNVTNNGTVSRTITAISIVADYEEVKSTSSVVVRNETSIIVDGELAAPAIRHTFIQDRDYAVEVANYVLSEYSVAAANVVLDARGNIATALREQVTVVDTKGSTNADYIITKQDLQWQGSLSGEIELRKVNV